MPALIPPSNPSSNWLAWRNWPAVVVLAVLLNVGPVLAADDTVPAVSFGNDVMAVLSKAGCNMGVCHGNKYGKGGFKLSLRGDDPGWDFSVLSRDLNGRRVNPLEPDASLLLLKATMQVPHQEIDSPLAVRPTID